MPPRHRKATKPLASTALRRKVGAALAASPAFRRLPAARRRKLAVEAAGIAGFTGLTRKVDFPNFVAALIAGVFDAIVKGSIQQMEAYAALLASVTTSVDRFMEENRGDGARDWLAASYPELFVICVDGRLAVAGQCPEDPQGKSGRAGGASRSRARRKAPTSSS